MTQQQDTKSRQVNHCKKEAPSKPGCNAVKSGNFKRCEFILVYVERA